MPNMMQGRKSQIMLSEKISTQTEKNSENRFQFRDRKKNNKNRDVTNTADNESYLKVPIFLHTAALLSVGFERLAL